MSRGRENERNEKVMRVLVVDDDIATVDVVQNSIDWKKLGVKETFSAYNISHAKKILLEHEIDIIISDIEMPQGSGIELLEWLREQQMPGEFLFLTCHENFDYAARALKNQASEYLLKPFDVNVMEAALKKIILKIRETRQLIEESEYGKWVRQNRRQLKLAFWNQVLSGHLVGDEATESIEEKRLNIDVNASYRLVISRIRCAEQEKEKMNQGLMLFIMENIHSEVLCGRPDNESILSRADRGCYMLTAICREEPACDVNRKCRELRRDIRAVFDSEITTCISRNCTLPELYDTYRKNLTLLEENVGYRGMLFHEEDIGDRKRLSSSMFELARMEQLLAEKQKMKFLSYLKKRLSPGDGGRHLQAEELKRGKEEILQAVYTYLGKKGIQASALFADDDLREMEQKASQSAADLIRWASFLLDCMTAFEEKIKKQYRLSDRINEYVREHFRENIGRNEVAQEFHLSAEYLAKVYKQETGKTLKDYITECRISEAKRLLEQGERVSEAAEAVGFDNFTYFSTVFKKITGISPNQYRRK